VWEGDRLRHYLTDEEKWIFVPDIPYEESSPPSDNPYLGRSRGTEGFRRNSFLQVRKHKTY
jgi:hypothetical protein